MQTVSLLGLLLLLVPLAAAQYEEEASESAPYNVIRSGKDYEEREYPPAKWVCHQTVDIPGARAMKRSFPALFRYITGSNENEEEIPMTAPVTMHRKEEVFQMCFYLPADHQASPPTPTNAEVYIEERPAHTVLARTFGGYLWKDSQWALQAKLLKESLEEAGEQGVDYSSFYSAGYDSPMKWTNRRNEVWYVKDM